MGKYKMWELWKDGTYMGEFSTTKIREITKIHGTILSKVETSMEYKSYKIVRVGKTEDCENKYNNKNPISQEEIEEKKKSLSIGEEMELTITQYDILNSITIDKKEVCKIESLSKDVVIFRRKNGLKVTITYKELCMMDRGRKVRP